MGLPPPNRGVTAALGKSLEFKALQAPLRVGPGCVGLQHAATASSQTSRPGPPRPTQPHCEHWASALLQDQGCPCPTDPSMPGLGRGDSDAENLTCSKCALIPAIKSKSKGKTPTQTGSTCQPSPRNMLVPHWGRGGGVGVTAWEGAGCSSHASFVRDSSDTLSTGWGVRGTLDIPGWETLLEEGKESPSLAGNASGTKSNDLQRASTAPSIPPKSPSQSSP